MNGSIFIAPIGTTYPTETSSTGEPVSLDTDGVTTWVVVPVVNGSIQWTSSGRK